MSIENPWFATRFSREDFATVARLRYGRPYRDRHFEPLLLDPKGAVGSSSWQLRIQGCSGVHDAVKFSRVELMTARWAFLVSALGQVFAETKRQFPDMDDVRWVPCLPNWRELVLPDSHVEAGAFAEERLRAICAGRNLLVDTGVRIQPDEASTEFNLTGEARTTIRVVLDVEQLTDEVAHSITEQCWARTGHIEVPTGRRWFPWEHVEEFLYRPSRLDLELLNHWEATPRATELEKRMISAATDLRVDEVERMLAAGANIDALDDSDETALSGIGYVYLCAGSASPPSRPSSRDVFAPCCRRSRR